MAYLNQNGRGYLSGLGTVTAASLTTTGDIEGAIVRGTTALEFPAHATNPGVRCTTDADTGMGRTAANQVSWIAGGTETLLSSATQILYSSSQEFVALGKLENRSLRVRTSRTQDITAASDTLTVSTGQEVIEVTLSAGNITITAAPFIANGSAGQEITIVNVDATDTLTLPDEATTAGCNMELRAATRALVPLGGYLKLRYSTALAAWHEIGFG